MHGCLEPSVLLVLHVALGRFCVKGRRLMLMCVHMACSCATAAGARATSGDAGSIIIRPYLCSGAPSHADVCAYGVIVCA
jgi:hypothetical protein